MAAPAAGSGAARGAASTAEPDGVRVVYGCSASEARSIVADSDSPVLFRGMIDRWPARHWAPEPFAVAYGGVSTLFRVHRRPSSTSRAAASESTGVATKACGADPRIVWEGDCSYCHATFAEFFAWAGGASGSSSAADAASAAGPLASHCASECFAYADYKYMHQLFAESPDALAAVDWAQSFGQPADGADSTLWLGSRGAWTQCHQDSYGANLVAQLHGTKRWTLYPPSAGSRGLYPTRIPYEQSSVFSAVAVHNPDLSRHPRFSTVAREARTVLLEPGEVLFVPKHWWHDVQTVSELALSVNHW
jgi:HSPB1-associated protein 1